MSLTPMKSPFFLKIFLFSIFYLYIKKLFEIDYLIDIFYDEIGEDYVAFFLWILDKEFYMTLTNKKKSRIVFSFFK